MMARCYRKSCHAYKNYGGRGIRVCKRWRQFENFAADMGPMPQGKTIERLQNNLGYWPSNCSWITKAEQNRNKRTVKKFNVGGDYYTIPDLSKKYKIKTETLRKRLDKGWSVRKAITAKPLTPYEKGILAARARWGLHA